MFDFIVSSIFTIFFAGSSVFTIFCGEFLSLYANSPIPNNDNPANVYYIQTTTNAIIQAEFRKRH